MCWDLDMRVNFTHKKEPTIDSFQWRQHKTKHLDEITQDSFHL